MLASRQAAHLFLHHKPITKMAFTMKKILLSTIAIITISVAAIAAPSAKTMQLFNLSFPNAKDIKWYDDKGNATVSFTQNGKFEKIEYNKKGKCICAWKYGDAKDLPLNVLLAVNSAYEGKEIYGVTEFTYYNETVYDIKLRDNKNNWYSVKANPDGSFVETDSYHEEK
jgi:hypothetical protein